VLIIAALSCAIWVYLLLFRGGFWKANEALPVAKPPTAWPAVTVVIPARNEAATIGNVLTSHHVSNYPGSLDIIVADDNSTDATAEIASSTPGERPSTLIPVAELPRGWSGKLWALESAIADIASRPKRPRYILFTDADIEVSPTLLTKMIAIAERDELALTSIMAKLDNSGFWGRHLVPAFIFFFQKLYPFPLINDPSSPVAGAAGGVVLIRWTALQKIGGISALKGALIDDCTLAEKVKTIAPGTKIGLYLSSEFAEATSLRDNSSFASMETMVTRTAYAQLGYSFPALLGTLAGLLLVYGMPVIGIIAGIATHSTALVVLGITTWVLMTVAYTPTARIYGEGVGFAMKLPFTAMVYGWFTWLSGWRHIRGRGNAWKGRTYGHS